MRKDNNEKFLKRLDKKVNRLLFPHDKPRAYTSSRDLAGCILEKIALDCDPKIRDRFNQTLEQRYGKGKVYREGEWPPNHALFLLEVCPVDICDATVIAFQSSSQQKP